VRLLPLILLVSVLSTTAEPVTSTVLVAFDVETTGFVAKRERIVEIGAVKFRGSEILASTNWLVNPGRPMPGIAARVHGISDAMVADAPAIADVLPQFLRFVGNAPLVAHNAPFDTEFLAVEADRIGVACPANTVIDSLLLARLWFPLSPTHKLEDLTRHLKLGTGGHHRALADATYVHKLVAYASKELVADVTLQDLARIAECPWPTPSGKQD